MGILLAKEATKELDLWTAKALDAEAVGAGDAASGYYDAGYAAVKAKVDGVWAGQVLTPVLFRARRGQAFCLARCLGRGRPDMAAEAVADDELPGPRLRRRREDAEDVVGREDADEVLLAVDLELVPRVREEQRDGAYQA